MCNESTPSNAEAKGIDGVRRSRQVRDGDLRTTIREVLPGVREGVEGRAVEATLERADAGADIRDVEGNALANVDRHGPRQLDREAAGFNAGAAVHQRQPDRMQVR